MKNKFLILSFVVLIGISLFFIPISSADPARTIAMKTGLAYHANTVITGNGGTLYKVMGRATSANASYVIYDSSTIGGATLTYNQVNILTEGGEPDQYDQLPLLDFGEEGIRFSSGLTVITTTVDICVHYR